MMLEYQEVYRHPRVGKRTIQAVWEMGEKMKLIATGRLNLIRQPEFLAAEAACMAVFWPSPDIECGENLSTALGCQQRGPIFLPPWHSAKG